MVAAAPLNFTSQSIAEFVRGVGGVALCARGSSPSANHCLRAFDWHPNPQPKPTHSLADWHAPQSDAFTRWNSSHETPPCMHACQAAVRPASVACFATNYSLVVHCNMIVLIDWWCKCLRGYMRGYRSTPPCLPSPSGKAIKHEDDIVYYSIYKYVCTSDVCDNNASHNSIILCITRAS